ncbi:MAG TPA: winged helix-turn-helix domain-containing protein, partial [Woeseiaceae bacterium]|nr:winged helix-turn-helix domain-containing protein [Woeseiaceae bacterium]
MPHAAGNRRVYRFGDFTLDTGRASLCRRDEEIRLRPQSFAVLRLLLDRHGELVTREEFHTDVWGHRAVTDDSLAQCLIDIRRAIDDTKREIIRTVPRRGYVFAAEVRVSAPEASPRSARTTARAGAAIAIVVGLGVAAVLVWSGRFPGLREAHPLVDPHSVAVLPFDNTGPDPKDAYVVDGISNELRDQL